jgi:uncharacterized protein YneF (UPF0154 family)
MRYNLRTLLIVLAIGPPMLAGAWLYISVFRAAFSTFTPRDGLWVALLLGFAIGFWINHKRSQKRISALAEKIVRIRD